ncbi:MAG: transposase [Candidatus Nitrosocosmicus sp.]|nr:transposase [Candidatus Nitrosocosmicus sp.]MDN5867416.1 transposase [Candidatus Nitrosocosmicus sp.]
MISTEKNKELIKDIVINKSPTTFGYLKNTWSIRLWATYLTSLLGMNISPKQTWRIVHDLGGMVYKQPKLLLKKEKDYEQKKEKIDDIPCSFKMPGFEDETWLYMRPYITRTYMTKGEQQKVVHPGTKKEKVNAFITLLYPYNGIKFNITGKTRNSVDFINHLRNIKRYVRKRSVNRYILVIDNASFHVSKKTKRYMET